MARLTYRPEIFDLPDLETAKSIILTPTVGLDTETRWARETPYLAQLFGEQLQIRPGQVVIDYGCGVGRLSKELVERFDCRVLGVDISVDMRAHAPRYVGAAGFSAVSRVMLHAMVESGFRADAAIAVWVLQHCPHPEGDIGLLASALKAGAPVGVANTIHRCVPTREKFYASDRKDVAEILAQAFGESRLVDLDREAVGERIATASWCRIFRG